MRTLFGTDGIRGLANTHPITAELALQLGKALAFTVKSSGREKILIGKDTRLSGYMLEYALAAGICSMGVNVQVVGPLPTPGIAFTTTSMRAAAGLVISASHNPFQDNGIKIFDHTGNKLPDAMELTLENLITSQQDRPLPVPPAENIGKISRIDDASGRYIVALKNTFPKNFTLDGIHLVLDCAHGATYKVAPHVFSELGAQVTLINASPNGTNINDNCGAVHPQAMAEKVREVGADIGLAFDGDGDRLIVADESGTILDGDNIMAICAAQLLRKERLQNKTVVATVMSNMGLEKALAERGAKLLRSQVGDRYVVEMMRQQGCNFGGEQSGHLIFLDHNTTGDGILAGLQLLAIMLSQDQPISRLAGIMTPYPQVLKNVRLATKGQSIHPKDLPELQRVITDKERALGTRGRILVRASGTEPVMRIMVEGENQGEIEQIAKELCSLIKQETALLSE